VARKASVRHAGRLAIRNDEKNCASSIGNVDCNDSTGCASAGPGPRAS
jgi:hypothetical protein